MVWLLTVAKSTIETANLVMVIIVVIVIKMATVANSKATAPIDW